MSVDLFETPLRGRPDAICGNIESLPFESGSFGAIVCVGEVLGYCDPRHALQEFGRVAVSGASLVCDFGSTLSARYAFTRTYGRTADIASDEYNGTEERVWVYHPEYIKSIIEQAGFRVLKDLGTHSLCAIACRLGFRQTAVGAAAAALRWLPQPRRFSDVRTIVSVRNAI
jgi:ubiquinone/menaquinone biosynthesis C-methylase UbiE